MRRVSIAVMMAGVAIASPAHARDFLYPWKSGATLQQASDDQEQCMTTARQAEKQTATEEAARQAGRSVPRPPAGSQSWLAPGLDGMTAFFNGYYDCLRQRGYSIRRMPSREYQVLKKAGGKAVMEAMVAPRSPHVEVPPGIIK